MVPLGKMASAIDDLLGDPERAEQLGQAGAKLFANRFTLEHSAASLAELYRP